MVRKRILIALLLLLVVLLISACVPGDGSYEKRPANFLSGVWHGGLSPLLVLIGLFDHKIRIYETLNTGWWYDFGFYLGFFGNASFWTLVTIARMQWYREWLENR